MALPIPIVVDNFADYYSEQKKLEAKVIISSFLGPMEQGYTFLDIGGKLFKVEIADAPLEEELSTEIVFRPMSKIFSNRLISCKIHILSTMTNFIWNVFFFVDITDFRVVYFTFKNWNFYLYFKYGDMMGGA